VADARLNRKDAGSGSSMWEKPRLTLQRLFGLDRSGPPPPQTLKGAPLNPWTIPNAIGFLRLALIPVFLVIALSSDDGTGTWPAILFGVVAWTDYADGIAARLTGQYSRLGTLMDPVTDRMLILSGVIVCWNFDLLPRWALAILAGRELAILALVRWGLRHNVDVRVNWPGRLAVWPVMAAIFAALVELITLGQVLLYIGLVLALVSFAMYFQIGLDYRAQRSS
jgi:CDP-diacylglycerol--glycerol-3-phosphate 3-phosphatidyltransferase